MSDIGRLLLGVTGMALVSGCVSPQAHIDQSFSAPAPASIPSNPVPVPVRIVATNNFFGVAKLAFARRHAKAAESVLAETHVFTPSGGAAARLAVHFEDPSYLRDMAIGPVRELATFATYGGIDAGSETRLRIRVTLENGSGRSFTKDYGVPVHTSTRVGKTMAGFDTVRMGDLHGEVVRRAVLLFLAAYQSRPEAQGN